MLPRVSRWLVASRFVQSVYAKHGIECDVVELIQSLPEGTPLGYESRGEVLLPWSADRGEGVRDVIEMARHVRELEITVAGAGPLQEHVETAVTSPPTCAMWASWISRPHIGSQPKRAWSWCSRAGPSLAAGWHWRPWRRERL